MKTGQSKLIKSGQNSPLLTHTQLLILRRIHLSRSRTGLSTSASSKYAFQPSSFSFRLAIIWAREWPRVRRLSIRIRVFSFVMALGATFSRCPFRLRVRHTKLCYQGQSTALFRAFTVCLSESSIKRVRLTITRSPARRLPT